MMQIGGKRKTMNLESFDESKQKCDDCGKYFDCEKMKWSNAIQHTSRIIQKSSFYKYKICRNCWDNGDLTKKYKVYYG
jgi:hypothetical protein